MVVRMRSAFCDAEQCIDVICDYSVPIRIMRSRKTRPALVWATVEVWCYVVYVLCCVVCVCVCVCVCARVFTSMVCVRITHPYMPLISLHGMFVTAHQGDGDGSSDEEPEAKKPSGKAAAAANAPVLDLLGLDLGSKLIMLFYYLFYCLNSSYRSPDS